MNQTISPELKLKIRAVSYMLALLILVSMLNANPVQAQETAISCTSPLISPVLSDRYINVSSIEIGADGQIAYLVSGRDEDSSTLFHVSPDNNISEIGELDKNMLGIYNSPRWDIDFDAWNIVFTAYLDDDYTQRPTAMLMDMDNAESSILMAGVNEYDYGRDAERIWWLSNIVDDPADDFGFYIYDPATEALTALSVPAMAESDAYGGDLVRILPDGDVLFTVTRFLEEGRRISYYHGDVESGNSNLLHSENTAPDGQFPETTIVLDESIVYIDPIGEYVEIDFDGNRLRTIPLMESGEYYNLQLTPGGILFTHFDDFKSSLYYVSDSEIISSLLPADATSSGYLWRIEVITAANGDTMLWFNVKDFEHFNRGTLYVYDLPGDDSAITEPVFVMNDIGDFYSSPAGDYVVVNEDSTAILIDTRNFEQTVTATDYGKDAVFFDEAQAHVLNEGRLQFVDTERNIIYYSTPMPPGEGEDFVLYARLYDSEDSARVSLPEVNVPFDYHSYSFMLAEDGSVIYVGEDWQSLYRARCDFTQT